MQKEGILFSAYTYNPLHAGVGQTIGLVDLPLEREKHTGYPCVYATGVKGALRSYMKQENLEKDTIDAVFGYEDGAGGWIFTDLKILFFPVRASENSFAWVTCDHVLTRFIRDCGIVTGKQLEDGLKIKSLKTLDMIPEINRDFKKEYILLEDFIFKKPVTAVTSSPVPLHPDFHLSKAYKVDNDVFDYLVTYATQIIARNKLKEDKTSDNLWYEETLPADTLMYSFIIPSCAGNGTELKKIRDKLIDAHIQMGGGETVGYGIMKVCEIAVKGADHGSAK